MESQKLWDRFVAKCPFAVLTQLAVRCLIREDLDHLFEAERSRQYRRELAFSSLALAVADVTLGFAENFNQAYKVHREQLGVSLASFYEKLNATELPVSEAVVRHSAARARELQDELHLTPREILPGYRVFSIDGNHLQESEKRLEPLRDAFDAPLAGTIVARFDHQRQLFDSAYLLADAHAQESSTQQRIVDDLQPGDVAICDRHYCVLDLLRGISAAGACYVIRQHGRFQGDLQGSRVAAGRTATGAVYEQGLSSRGRNAFSMRRITIELDQPTRDGDLVVHVLSNLPASAPATAIADLYLRRWEEETAFYYLTTTLTCERKSVSHPRAALFLFCMAMLAYNIRQIVFAALSAEHPAEQVAEVSHHQVSVEVSRYTDGLLTAIEDSEWESRVPDGAGGMASQLRQISRTIDLRKYRKSRRGPKKKKTIANPGRPRTHLSTAKALVKAKRPRP